MCSPKIIAMEPFEAAISMSMSMSRLQNLTQPKGTIPCVHIGHERRYFVHQLQEWADEQIENQQKQEKQRPQKKKQSADSELSAPLYRTKEIQNRIIKSLQGIDSNSRRRGYMPCIATTEEIEAAFSGACCACGVSEKELGSKLHVDHCHETGKFRGWLCSRCNTQDVLANT